MHGDDVPAGRLDAPISGLAGTHLQDRPDLDRAAGRPRRGQLHRLVEALELEFGVAADDLLALQEWPIGHEWPVLAVEAHRPGRLRRRQLIATPHLRTVLLEPGTDLGELSR